jgi:hypothetical protein
MSMSLSRDELLRPSLGGSRIAKAPYSVRTTFLAAFFGGPFAAVAITALNSLRLQRLGRDALPLTAALIAYLAFLTALMATEWGDALVESVKALAGKQAFAYVDRLIALALFGLGYMLHRKEQRSADFMDMPRPNGWIAGLACIVGGHLVLFGIAFLATMAARP